MVATHPNADADSAPTVAAQGPIDIGPRAKRVRKGDIVGNRFVSLGVIGEGGMGTVARAYDPTLCREVALKRMRLGALDERAAERMLREAQSMAKLSHPNVVAIYDAFVDGSEVTIAMEYVPGETLRTWMKSEPRPWADVVAKFRVAGEGLAAAHQAGLVHRDFKPANVLVTPEGGVKVGDFGLAKDLFDGTSDSGHGTMGDALDSVGDLATPLTDANTVMGTPRYMAPEQRKGGDIGPAADQFAFCVALWEALVGEAPFSSSDKHRRKLPDWPRTSHVPRSIVAAIRRGLAHNPAARWPSMEECLAGLNHDPRRRLQTLALGGGGIAVITALAYGPGGEVEQPPCTGSQTELENLWGERPRRIVRKALLDADPSANTEDITSALDEYVQRWTDGHRDACEATMVRREQSPTMMDQRMFCLAAAKRDFAVAVELLRIADGATATKAGALVRALPKVGRCADLEALASDIPPPDDPAVAQEVLRLEEPLAKARGLNIVGRYPEAQAAIEPVHQAAEKLGWGPLGARAAEVHGNIVESLGDYERSVQLHQEAVRLALRHGVTKTAITAASNLAFLLAYELDRPAEADAWVLVAEGLVEGFDPGGRLEADVAQTRAAMAHRRGDYAAAAVELQTALRLLPESSGHAGNVRHNLAATLFAAGQYAEAAKAFRGVVAHFEGLYGPEHPAVAEALGGLGASLREVGKFPEAESILRRALAINEEALGESHDDVADNLYNLANVVSDQGRSEEALLLYARAVTVWENAGGPDHLDVATGLSAIAVEKAQLGHTEEAEMFQRRALAIIEKARGPEDPEVAYSLTNLGDLLRQRGELADAEQVLERALRLRETKLGALHPTLAATLDRLGRLHADAGHIEEARSAFSRARDIQRAAKVAQAEQDETQARLDAL